MIYLFFLHNDDWYVGSLISLQLWAGLRFTVPRLKDTHKTVQFELQIRRYNSVWTCIRDTSYDTCWSWSLLLSNDISWSESFSPSLSVSTVKMRIIPTARLYPTSWRWLFRLKSFYKGESSVTFPSFELFGNSLTPWCLLTRVLTSAPPFFFFKCVSTR